MPKIKPLIHVLIFAVYPVIFLFVRNIIEVKFIYTLLPVFINMFTAIMIFFIFNKFIKNSIKSSFVTSVLIIFILNAYIFYKIFNELFSTNIFVFTVLSLIVIIFLCLLIIKKEFHETKVLNIINSCAIILLIIAFTSVPLNIYASMFSGIFKKHNLSESKTEVKPAVINNDYPDIYYLILDGYADNKALKEYYNYDNSEFLSWLKNKGFYVAENSTANYPSTIPSITSSLNMRYINEDLKDIHNDNQVGLKLKELRHNNETVKYLKSKGYTFQFIRIVENDMLIDLEDISDIKYSASSLKLINDFSFTLYKTSVIGLFDIYENSYFQTYMYNFMKQSLLEPLDYLSSPKKNIKRPLFVYAHILAPHPPYLFDRYGNELKDREVNVKNYVTDWLKKDLYLDYLIFINGKMKKTINDIIAGSEREPVIIIQSDHGSQYHLQKIIKEYNDNKKDLIDLNAESRTVRWTKEEYESLINKLMSDSDFIKNSFSILNAYYFPGENNKKDLYQSITPINSFRILFNTYFEDDFNLLEDKNYINFGNSSKLPEVTDKVKNRYIND